MLEYISKTTEQQVFCTDAEEHSDYYSSLKTITNGHCENTVGIRRMENKELLSEKSLRQSCAHNLVRFTGPKLSTTITRLVLGEWRTKNCCLRSL